MRKDMDKKLVERPRVGGGWAAHPRRCKRGDDRMMQGMRRPHLVTYGSKSLSENLKPLYRYLDKQVGRPWDKVYGDLCKNLDRRSTIMDHIFLHIEDHVAIHMIVDKRGRMLALPGERGWGAAREDWWQPLFVDPKTGILRRSDSLRQWWAWRQKRKQGWRSHLIKKPTYNHPTKVIDDKTELHQIEGIWFEVVFDTLPKPTRVKTDDDTETWETPAVYDVLKRKHVIEGKRFAKSKRQLSKGQLNARGLANQVD